MQQITTTRAGRLLVIGGAEDRVDDKRILSRFIALAGGASASIVVLTAASEVPEEVWADYDEAFGALGVTARAPLHIPSRAVAEDPATARRIAAADGVFISGGDQESLLDKIGGTATAAALRHALAAGACIAGTSAGASAMSAHMLLGGKDLLNPERGAVSLGAGLGLMHGAVIDQHFSERHRLARLLSVVASDPGLLGIGIDEDTALVVTPGAGIEVIGNGAVTLLDGRNVIEHANSPDRGGSLELIDVRLHMLPDGSRYRRPGTPGDAGVNRVPVAPAPLQFLVEVITKAHHEHA